MIVNGFPDLLQTSLFNRTVTQTKQDAAIAGIEVVTGRKEQLSRHLGGQAGEYNLVSKALADIETDKTRLGLADSRFAQTDIGLNLIRETISGFGVQAVADISLNGAVGYEQTQESARSYLSTVLLALNTEHAGRNLFAGDETGSSAVPDAETVLTSIETALGGATDAATIGATISTYFATGGGFETDVYLGGAGQASSVGLPNGVDVEYDVKADNQAFRDILEGLSRIIFAPADGGFDFADNARQILQRGEDGVIALQASVGRQQNQIESALEANQRERNVLIATDQKLAGVDAYEAASELQRLQVQLEAAYTVTSRLTRLTLANFIS